MCVYTYLLYISVRLRVCESIYIYTYIIYIYVYVQTFLVYIYIYTYKYTHICMHILPDMCTRAYMHTYIYRYTYTYTYVYMFCKSSLSCKTAKDFCMRILYINFPPICRLRESWHTCVMPFSNRAPYVHFQPICRQSRHVSEKALHSRESALYIDLTEQKSPKYSFPANMQTRSVRKWKSSAFPEKSPMY